MEEIKIEIHEGEIDPRRGSHKVMGNSQPLKVADEGGSSALADSYNDDDEIEDENRNPATIQINQSCSVTRAGA